MQWEYVSLSDELFSELHDTDRVLIRVYCSKTQDKFRYKISCHSQRDDEDDILGVVDTICDDDVKCVNKWRIQEANDLMEDLKGKGISVKKQSFF